MSTLNTNDRIRAREVRLIDQSGANLGIVSILEAKSAAREAGLDLIEISPLAEPPVCRIGDFGKFKYEEAKKLKEARKNQVTTEIKELKVRPNIDIHDYEVKLKAAREFVAKGHKVKFTCRFRGREMGNQELGSRLLSRVKEDLGESVRVDRDPLLEGRQMTMVVTPK